MTSAPDTQTLPTIVIIHDAWHTPTHYSKMIDLLSAQGFEVACPQLLSCSSEQNNTSSFNDDVNLLYPLIFDIASDGKDIICVLHGYGGYIGTEILGDLTATQRAQNGLPGGVVHIVWISAVMPDTGVSMQMAMGGEFPDYTSLQVPYRPDPFSQPPLNLQAFSMPPSKTDFSPHAERRHTHNRGTRSLSLQRPRSHGNGPLV